MKKFKEKIRRRSELCELGEWTTLRLNAFLEALGFHADFLEVEIACAVSFPRAANKIWSFFFVVIFGLVHVFTHWGVRSAIRVQGNPFFFVSCLVRCSSPVHRSFFRSENSGVIQPSAMNFCTANTVGERLPCAHFQD